MMFASNQVLQVSGSLGHKGELECALEFGMRAAGCDLDKPKAYAYQITEDGRYCIGWTAGGEAQEGWELMPFPYNTEKLVETIQRHLSTQKVRRDIWGGSYSAGFLMKVIPESMSDEADGIRNPFYGYLSFEPFTCFYSK